MTDAIHTHHPDDVGDFINHPVVAHTDAPIVFSANEFPAAGRARIIRQSLNCLDDAVVNLLRKAAEVAFGRAFKEDLIHGHRRLRSAK